MPVLFQKIISRADLHANREVVYLFGDNMLRRGLGGQAEEMRGEPNAVGIRTKRAPTYRAEDLWGPADEDEACKMIWHDFKRPCSHVERGGIVVIPSDGIGTGRAMLRENAPAILQFIEDCILHMRMLD